MFAVTTGNLFPDCGTDGSGIMVTDCDSTVRADRGTGREHAGGSGVAVEAYLAWQNMGWGPEHCNGTHSEDIALQIAEYARVSEATRDCHLEKA